MQIKAIQLVYQINRIIFFEKAFPLLPEFFKSLQRKKNENGTEMIYLNK